MIDDKDFERLKEVFITRKECQNNMTGFESKISKEDVRLSVIENQLKLITWLLYAVSGGIITVLLTMIFGVN